LFTAYDTEVPLQLYQLLNDKVQFHRALPADDLKPYIYYYWWLQVAPGDTSLEVIPDNAVDLVMSPDISRFSIVYLPESETFSIPLTGPITYLGISFRAESVERYFNLAPESISHCVPGEDTTEGLAIGAMVEGIQSIKQPDQLAPTLDALTAERLHKQPIGARHQSKFNINKALAAMQASVGVSGMHNMAEHFGLSDRQFRRVMTSLFGYGPKKVQRVMRLQASLKEILSNDASALEDGYFDEAHKIKEIQALTGLTPGQIKKMSEIYNSMK